MLNTATIIVIYALIVGVGGAIGYVKSASMVSLIAGVSSAIALLLSAVALYAKKKWGFYAALGIGGLLLVVFVLRFIKTGAIMPAGFMALLSLIFLITLFARAGKLKRKS